MRILKKIVIVIAVILLLAAIGLFLYAQSLKPQYSGDFEMDGLKEKVTVIYDENGVPHIEAKNQEDAYRTLGYVHAQDRLWQMEVMRRIAAGRLSEIFGKDLISVDKFMGSLGIEEQAIETIKNIDKTSHAYQYTQAYLEGINTYIDNGKKPIEFTLLGIEKEHYSLKDMYNVFGYMAFSFAHAHKTDPLVNEISEKLPPEYLSELDIPMYTKTLLKSTNNTEINGQFAKAVHKIMDKMPAPQFEGSNSWVVNGAKTKSGKVIFANDPHIEYAQPSVWYQAHIKTPDYEMYGFNLALTPFPLLGHNRQYAYGLTMFLNDDTDFFVEKNNPNNANEYLTEKGYKPYKTLNKTIKVKDGEDITYQLKVSRHGPIINEVVNQVDYDKPVAMSWIYTQQPNVVIDISYAMSHAKSMEEFRSKSAAKLVAPGLNIMYGDASGNIAWFGSAKLYSYRDGINRNTFLDGSTGNDEIQSYYPFDKNPHAVNPSWNYVYSANNQHDPIDGKLYPGYYVPQDRAKRITDLLDKMNDIEVDDMKKMITDVQSSTIPDFLKTISSNINVDKLDEDQKKALKALVEWDGKYNSERIAPTIYSRFVYEFCKATFADEIGEKGFAQFVGGIYLQSKAYASQLGKTESIWWDDISTKDIKEDKQAVTQEAFMNTVDFLSNQLGDDISNWKWKRVCSVEHKHALGDGGALLQKIFSVGPFSSNGGIQVLNNQIYDIDSTGLYKITAGPSTRRIIDFNDVENSYGIVPTGQSGNRMSPFYKNQSGKYNNDEFVKLHINPEDYKNSDMKLYISPKGK